jgi:hypothetical protein
LVDAEVPSGDLSSTTSASTAAGSIATCGSPRHSGVGGVRLPREGADDDERAARERDPAEREEEEERVSTENGGILTADADRDAS